MFAARSAARWEEDREALIGVLGRAGAGAHARRRLRHGLPDAVAARLADRPRPERVDGRDRRRRGCRLRASCVADALPLPFADGEFERVFTGHFYGHLVEASRVRFLREARRVAPELVVVDTALRPDHEPEEWQKRKLNDGSRHEVYKRYFSGEGLVDELGGGEVLHAGPWFVAVRTSTAAG